MLFILKVLPCYIYGPLLFLYFLLVMAKGHLVVMAKGQLFANQATKGAPALWTQGSGQDCCFANYILKMTW